MKQYTHYTQGTCSRAMLVELDDNNIVTNCQIIGGCMGNTLGLAALVKGQPATEVIARLKGTPCGNKGTSCPDQLACALEAALKA